MNRTLILAAASAFAAAQPALAQQAGITWEGEIEVGVDSTLSSDDAASEFTDTYVSAEVAFEAALTQNLTAFGTLSLESVIDAEDNRAFDDMGIYVGELGLRYSFGGTTVAAGKISPIFAVAWDEAPGFYGTSLAEDYELSEMIGASFDTALGGGTLSAAVFYVDDTALSDSIGTKRGRVSIADGGVGNTGEFNNVALQYTRDFGETTAWIGARYLSAGDGDLSDETGLVAGLSHSFDNGADMIVEVAHFDGAGGTEMDATYVTTGLAYALEDWTFSASATGIDTSDGNTDSLLAIGVDRSLTDNLDASFGIARFDVGGVQSTAVGLSTTFSF